MACLGVVLVDAVNTWYSAKSELTALAHNIEARSTQVRQESLSVALRMPEDEVCDRRGLRRLISRAHYVRNIGKIQGTRIYCDAMDGGAASIELGPPDAVRADGLRMWIRPDGLWGAMGYNAIVIDHASFVDALLPADTLVATFDVESGRSFAHSAPVPEGLATAAKQLGEGTLTASGYLAALSLSGDGNTLQIAARPLSSIRHAAVLSLPLFLLAGSVFGVVLAIAVLTALRRRGSLDSELRRALRQCQLQVALQPIVSVHDAGPCIVGFECLARWRLADGEFIPPTVFVPMCERAGLGSQLAICMATNLVRDFGGTLQAHPDVYVALNLSSADVADVQLLDYLDRIFAGARIPSSQLVIELTERTFEADGLEAGLAKLRKAGHRLSIDDFGTGASNASRLASLQPEMVKVDRSFLLHAESGGAAANLLAQLVGMAHSCGARVVIEGVETLRQSQLLREFDAIFAQGFFWHYPMTPADATQLLVRESHAINPDQERAIA